MDTRYIQRILLLNRVNTFILETERQYHRDGALELCSDINALMRELIAEATD